MFGKTWKISESKYKATVERDVKIKMSDGTEINADIFRPDSDEKFPAIFGFHPYDQEAQTAPIKHSSFSTFFFRNPGQEKGNAYIEAGDSEAFVRRGYVYVIANIRGTGKSGGKYPFLAPPEAQDGVEIIEWIARQPWCNGNVGMFGVSYFAWIQLFIAALNPPHLKCFFAPWGRGYLEYCSPRLVENTEVIGPIVVNLYASTTDEEVFWFVSLREVDPQGNERVLTRGWLRGSHREIDATRSKPWEPFHPHTRSEPLIPNKIYEFNIPIVPTGTLFKAGSMIKLKISCTDDQPKNPLEMIACGNLYRQSPSRITVYHDPEHPSCLFLPITRGNVLETFISEGKPYL
jgi:predicted acyl esterase